MNYILIIACFCSCSKDFLDRNPTTDLNNNTFWNTEADLKSFSNGIYNDAGNTGKIFYDKMSMIFVEMLSFVKKPVDLDTELDKWLYALKHLTEFKKRPAYLSGPEFDQLFNLAKYANLTKEEQEMYNASLKRKWDNKNVLDYAIETAVETAVKEADQIATERERAKAEKEKKEIARKMLAANESIEKIVEYTGLATEEIQALQS